MKFALRFIIPLALVLSALTYSLIPLVESLTLKWFTRDLDIRSELIFNTLKEKLVTDLTENQTSEINKLFDHTIQDERLFALGFCNLHNKLQFRTSTFTADHLCETPDTENEPSSQILRQKTGSIHASSHKLFFKDNYLGKLILIHDMSFIDRRNADTFRYIFYLFLTLAGTVSLVTIVIAQLSLRGMIAGMRALLRGEGLVRPFTKIHSRELLPIAKDLRALVRDLEQERRVKDEQQIAWTPKTLKMILNEDLMGDEVLVVSNREPYIHNRKGANIEVQHPASGVVTALEPIMRACSGTWIAHGSGTADREVVDTKDHVQVPPENPSYQIRRVWLTKEQEAGYYYGFANEGLWPLCHIAHTRPTFRTSDWKQYVDVNQKFAEAVIQESKTDNPVILIQDYHFALLPKLIRDRLPQATIITFWHIPWPNPEAFGICPWREEILSGLLGSSILGFHTKFHCNNFVDTVDRFLEARIDKETSTISHLGKRTAVRNYPISIDWPPRWIQPGTTPRASHDKIYAKHEFPETLHLGIGVDRLDYTKGIIERFLAIERLFELYPEWIGKFSFIQIAAPTRSSIEQYQHFHTQVTQLAIRVNGRFGKENYQPIVLKVEHHDPEQVYEYFRSAAVCLVTSLHDGMNLVAKEYVAARDDEQGVLILSQFTGAARELPEALIVNPYNIDQCATAIHVALSMPPLEQKERMKNMRGLIQEHNVYRWAGRMLIDAAQLRRKQRLWDRVQETETFMKKGFPL